MKAVERRIAALETRLGRSIWQAYIGRDDHEWPDWALEAFISDATGIASAEPMTDDGLRQVIAGNDAAPASWPLTQQEWETRYCDPEH